MEVSEMKEMDCVEVIVEKEKYVKDGVHAYTAERNHLDRRN